MPIMVTSGDPFRSSEPELLADMMATPVVLLPNVVTVQTMDWKSTDLTGKNMRGVHGTSRYARVPIPIVERNVAFHHVAGTNYEARQNSLPYALTVGLSPDFLWALG